MKRGNILPLFLLGALLAAGAAVSCTTRLKLQALANDSATSTLTLPEEKIYEAPIVSTEVKKDTIKIVDLDGHDMFLMKTVVDSTGEVTASDVLNAAVVTARFRNLAERDGKVQLEFRVIVPGAFKEDRWQMRFRPTVFVMEDSVKLDPVLLTGDTYREAQIYGNQRYADFVKKMESYSDIESYVGMEKFLQRYSPDAYKSVADSILLNEEKLHENVAKMEPEFLQHYMRIKGNATRTNLESKRGYMYYRYYMEEIKGLEMDSCARYENGNYIYDYLYELKPNPKLRKVDVVLDGEVLEMKRFIYRVPRSEPLTFYISSLASFIDPTERYLTKIISRRAEANASYNIGFKVGRYDVDAEYAGNGEVIEGIRQQLDALLDNKTFDLDSVVITASASPEGEFNFNNTLSRQRSESIASYFRSYMKHKVDSINAVVFFQIDSKDGKMKKTRRNIQPISFISHNNPENWDLLDEMIAADTTLTDDEKTRYAEISRTADPDLREVKMRSEGSYAYIRENLYPALRSVKFDFNLHRKGMVKDTVHTTVIDENYMAGVQALRDREFDTAAKILEPYHDFNAAVALCAVNRNYAAREILDGCPDSAEKFYMQAIIYARFSEDENAIKSFVEACKLDRSFINRGNLDPEIASLIKKYNINLLDNSNIK